MIKKMKKTAILLRHGIMSLWRDYHFLVPPRVLKKKIGNFGRIIVNKSLLNPLDIEDYNEWLKYGEAGGEYEELKYRPLFSVLIPVYNVKGKYLRECLDSVLKQEYDNYEICVVDDASTSRETLGVLKEYEGNEKIKIKYRKQNGHISRATNDALAMASGEYIVLMDNDDLLSENALYEVAKVLDNDKKIDMVYSDEDKITERGRRCDPNFKSDWAPDSLLSSNYISHLGVLRKSIVDKIGGFRVGFEGAQDYDLYLRFTEQTDRIHHIPKVLYHWRMVKGSTAVTMENKDYALERGRLALEDALKRRGIKGEAKIADNCPYYYIEYKIDIEPKVSIIVPMKDKAEMTRKCLESVYEKTDYSNYEVIVVDNNSVEKESFELFDEYKKRFNNFKVLKADYEFNYAKINNMAVKKSEGDYLVLLNNDIEVISSNWLGMMVGYAMQKHIGAVGAKLLYPDGTVQHAGVVLGLGVASHVFCGEEGEKVSWGGRLSVPFDYSAVTAACLVVSKKKWNEVGGMEEELKVAYNDVDFNLKLLEKGYYNVVLPMIKLYHYESKSRGKDDSPEKKKRFDDEQDFMRKKWKNRIENDEFYNPNYSRKKYYMLDEKDG